MTRYVVISFEESGSCNTDIVDAANNWEAEEGIRKRYALRYNTVITNCHAISEGRIALFAATMDKWHNPLFIVRGVNGLVYADGPLDVGGGDGD